VFDTLHMYWGFLSARCSTPFQAGYPVCIEVYRWPEREAICSFKSRAAITNMWNFTYTHPIRFHDVTKSEMTLYVKF
jgi:hypothetical protein